MNRICSGMRAFRPLEVLTLGYLFILTVLVLLFHSRVEGWIFYVLSHLLVMGFIVLLAWLSKKTEKRVISGVRDWYMLFLFVPMFEEMGGLIHLLVPGWINETLIAFDYWLFGVHPTVWLERFVHPWVTEFMQLSFVTYYFIFYLLGAYVYFVVKRRTLFRSLVLKGGLAFYVSFFGFMLFPAEGPWVTLKHLQTVPLEGNLFHQLAGLIEHHGTIPGGAFPSSHITVAYAILAGSYRDYRTLFYVLLPIFICMSVSTVYGRYHYTADVFAGIAIGLACAYLGSRIEDWWKRNVSVQI